MMILWSIATNAYWKGETLRHQVKTLDKIEYIKSRDGSLKFQQDMLVVSVPLCWTAWQQQVNKNHAYTSRQKCGTLWEVKMYSLVVSRWWEGSLILLLKHNYQRVNTLDGHRRLTKEKKRIRDNLYWQGLTLVGGDSKRIRLKNMYATGPTIYNKRKTCVTCEVDHGSIM